MKKTINFFIVLIAVMFFTTNVSHAAFVIKKASKSVTIQSSMQSDNSISAASATTAINELGATTTEESKTFDHVAASGSDAMPKVLYIILALLGWGWLAMGINDNFEDFDWLISLILYFLFYLPGLIYTLIKMKKYY